MVVLQAINGAAPARSGETNPPSLRTPFAGGTGYYSGLDPPKTALAAPATAAENRCVRLRLGRAVAFSGLRWTAVGGTVDSVDSPPPSCPL